MAFGAAGTWTQLPNNNWKQGQTSLNLLPSDICCDGLGFNVYMVTAGALQMKLLRSSDGGLTWQAKDLPTASNGDPNNFLYIQRSRVCCSEDGQTVYVLLLSQFGVRGRIFRSTNRGNSWTKRIDIEAGSSAFNTLDCDATGNILYLKSVSSLASQGQKIWRSTNGGSSFSYRTPNGLTDLPSGATATTSDDSVLVNFNIKNQYTSVNGGNNFSSKPIPMATANQIGTFNGFDMSDDQAYFFCGTDITENDTLSGGRFGIYRSLNQGNTWSRVLSIGNSSNQDAWQKVACSYDGSVVYAMNKNNTVDQSVIWRSGEPVLPSDNTFVKYQGGWVEPATKHAKLSGTWRNVNSIFVKQGNNWIQVE